MHRLSLALLALGLLACGGGGGSPPASTVSGVVSLRIAGGPGDGLKALQVQVARVEVEGPSGWIRYADATRSVDLVALSNGTPESLSRSTGPLLSGSFSRVRVGFAGAVRATFTDGTEVTAPAPEAVIVEAPLLFSGTEQGLVLVLDPGRSLQWREGGIVFRPSLQVFEQAALGRIHGRLTAGGQALAGVVVMAQSFPQFGVPRLLQRVLTGSDGSYVLDFLPKGIPLHVVSQPVTAAASYDPQASAALTLGEATMEWQGAFVSRASLATFHGAYTPPAAAAQSGEVQLLGPVQAGTEVKLFALRTVSTVREAAVETHRMEAIPSGSYVLRGYRTTWAGDGTSAIAGQNSVDLGLVEGFQTMVDFLW